MTAMEREPTTRYHTCFEQGVPSDIASVLSKEVIDTEATIE